MPRQAEPRRRRGDLEPPLLDLRRVLDPGPHIPNLGLPHLLRHRPRLPDRQLHVVGDEPPVGSGGRRRQQRRHVAVTYAIRVDDINRRARHRPALRIGRPADHRDRLDMKGILRARQPLRRGRCGPIATRRPGPGGIRRPRRHRCRHGNSLRLRLLAAPRPARNGPQPDRRQAKAQHDRGDGRRHFSSRHEHHPADSFDQGQHRGRHASRTRSLRHRHHPRRRLGQRGQDRSRGLRRPGRRNPGNRRRNAAADQPVAQPQPSAMQPALDRPGRPAELSRDLIDRAPLQVAQHDRGAEMLRQPPHLGVQHRRQLEVARSLRMRWTARLALVVPALGPAPLVPAPTRRRRPGTRRDSMSHPVQPGPERLSPTDRSGALQQD